MVQPKSKRLLTEANALLNYVTFVDTNGNPITVKRVQITVNTSTNQIDDIRVVNA